MKRNNPKSKSMIRNPSKQQLTNRLYDQGFSHYTMPSVKRLNNQSLQKKPLVARLYSINNNLIKEVKQAQTSIFFTKENSKKASKQHLREVYDNQMNFGYTTCSNFKKLNLKKAGNSRNEAISLDPKKRWNLAETKSKIGLEPISIKTSNISLIKNVVNNDSKKELKLINNRELKQTKIVMDKLRHTYLEKTKYYRNDRKEEEKPMETEESEECVEVQENDKSEVAYRRKYQEELDTYINFILKNSPNVDEFVYLVKNPNSDDPYDLVLKNYFDIQGNEKTQKYGRQPAKNNLYQIDKKISDYYTISAKGLCRFKEGRPIEFINLTDWLKERETYDKIKKLNFFVDFLKWKTIKMWRKSYKGLRKKVAMKNLEEKLFINYTELREAIISTKDILYNMSQLSFLDFNYHKDNQQEAISIYDFIKQQEGKANQTQKRISDFSRQAHEIYTKAVDNRLDILRNIVAMNNDNDNVIKRDGNQPFLRLQDNPYESLGFPDNMSYDKRSDLRKECFRFIRFAHLIDFMATDCLINVYSSTVKTFIEETSDLTNIKDPVILRDLEKPKPIGFKEPIFRIEIGVNLDFNGLEEKFEIENNEVEDYKAPKIEDDGSKAEDYKDYNIITYPFVHDYTIIEDFNEQQLKFIEFGQQRMFEDIKAKNIQNVCLTLDPCIEEFEENIETVLKEGMGALQAFNSFAKHPSINKYKAILEEWEENEDDETEQQDKMLIDPDDCIDQDFKFQLEKQLKHVFSNEFDKSMSYLGEFNQYLQIMWEYHKFDYGKLIDRHLAKPALTYNCVLSLLEHHKNLFENYIPYQADLGLFRIISKNFKTSLLNKPEEITNEIGSRLPLEIQERLEDAKTWLEESIDKLKVEIDDIRKFVTQSGAIEFIEKRFSYYKHSVRSCKDIIDTVKPFPFIISSNIHGLYKECKEKEHQLSTQMSGCNDKLTKKQEIFSKQIRSKQIPELENKCNELETILKDPKFVLKGQEGVYDKLITLRDELHGYKNQMNELNIFQEVLNLPKTKFESIGTLNTEIETKILLWDAHTEWFKIIENWNNAQFREIKVEEVQVEVETYQRKISKIRKIVPMTNLLLGELDTSIRAFSSLMPIVVALGNEKLKEKHIEKIENLIGQKLELDDITLKDLLKESILQHQKTIIGISVQVTQEEILKIQLDDIELRYGELSFPLKPFKDDTPKDSTHVLDDCTDLMNEVDKLIVVMNNVYGSKYLDEHKEEAKDKRDKILMLQNLLLEWLKFQKNYIYLESIFSQSEMKKPLQVEVKEFDDSVNKVYKQNVKKIHMTQHIAQLNKNGLISNYFNTFKKHNEILAKLNKKINNFLDSKREAFPRFYFVANDELIQIIANYNNPDAVQGFVGKLFENINRVDFGSDPQSLSIQAIIAREGEVLPLKTTINIKSEGVDKWMKHLELVMMESVHKVIKEGINLYGEQSKEDWYKKNAAQATSVISQIAWTANVEVYLKGKEKTDDNNMLIEELLGETNRNLDTLTELVKQPLTFSQHRSVVALISTEVHNRDVIEIIERKDVQSIDNFIWQQQLRYYYDIKKEALKQIYIRQITAEQNYGYEYYGPCTRIVITPLTDRCWITITSALQMKLGAAPAGPAGTGKTESTKDLAKSLGRFCLVFNCSDQINCDIMEKLFRGIIQQGAWTCLDEFNRIDIEVLSVVAQQLLEMRLALLKLEDEEEFFFCGAKCILKNTCGVFITMNPGYAGRTELPDNLKALFRPISMMIPNYALIAQILLFSEGFKDSKVLSSKMIRLYKLSSEQLSQQKHYDFGMRAVKSVLEMAGKLKREQPDANENDLLIKALRDANLPKFLKADLPLFNALIRDLFPNTQIMENKDVRLIEASKDNLISKNLEPNDAFIGKVSELYETMNVRFGTMIVGKAMTGKSTILHTLKDALNNLKSETPETEKNALYRGVDCVCLNPKSISMGELYGEENAITKDWQDGLASFYIRQGTNDEGFTSHWITFDGPVDALWIENMNSVLDDSRMLCLANGQRMRLKPEMRILFEVDSLEQASPATVSRCGMVYISEDTLSCEALISSWLKKFKLKTKDFLEEKELDFLGELCFSHIPSTVEYYHIMNKKIDTVDNQCIMSVFNMIESTLSVAYGFNSKGNDEYKIEYISLSFIFSMAWGFAATVQGREAEKIDNFIKKKFTNVNFPADSIVNCYIKPDQPSLELYNNKLESYQFESSTPFWEILVPTIDTMKLSHIIECHFDKGRNVFLIGDSGTGKSVLVSNLLKKFYTTKNIDSINFNFSAQTDSKTVQDTIMSGLFFLSQKARGAVFGRKNVIFIDDVNMPSLEQYGAQPPIELLRQLVDYNYLFNRDEMCPIDIVDTSLICLAAPPEGGRNKITTRFTRHFNLLTFPNARNTTIGRIFNSILSNYLNKFDETIKTAAHNIINASIEFYERIVAEKLPTPSKFHYTFNLRDLSKVFMGFSKATPDTIKDQKQLKRLWAHEMTRVFFDRLNCEEDREWFDKTIGKEAENFLKVRIDDLCLHKNVFTELFNMDDESSCYEEVEDNKKLIKALEDYQLDYNDRNKNKINLVFFQQAIDHILRIIRILRQPRGNAFLIGVGGLGKNSLSRLACFICKIEVIEMESSKNFKVDKFSEWLRKKVLIECAGVEAGINGKPLCWQVNDSQINDDKILEDINNLLNSGSVPNIFPEDEAIKLKTGLIALYEEKNIKVSENEVWQLFSERVRNNLHINLCMSPIGNMLKIWCRQFPGLVNNCTIDWFDQWSGSALQSVALKILEDKDIENYEGICSLIRSFHLSATETAEAFQLEMSRRFFITPKIALDNISLFVKLMKEKERELDESKITFSKGSVKLEEMAVIVEKLKIDIKEAQPLLEEQRKLAGEKLIELEKASKIANTKKQTVEKEANTIQVKTEQIEVINNQANSQLEKSMPKIQKAESEVRNIDRKELSTLRTLKVPPKMIEFIFSTVCLALGEKYATWKGTGIKMLNDLSKFVDKLINKIDRIKAEGSKVIPSKVLEILRKNLESEFFSDAKLESNIIAKPLGLWCKAIYDFASLKKQIEPLEKNAKEMSGKLEKAQKEYNEIANELEECKQTFQKLQDEFNEMETKKKNLEDNISFSKIKLERAEQLTSLLTNEGKRWKESIKLLELKGETLLADVFMGSSYISYMGPLTSQYRQNMHKQWEGFIKEQSNIKLNDNYDFLQTLGKPLILKDWCAAGLPSDEISQCSGLFSMLTNKWPMLIDPQLQANKWLKNIFAEEEGFVVVKSDFSEKKFNEIFKSALSNGYTILFEDCQENLNSSIDSVINKAWFVNHIDQRILINFNEETIGFNDGFRLFMTTKLSNPNFLPDVFIRTNVINFTVTQKGLEDQLLAEVMKLEKPEVEELKNQNIDKIGFYNKKMQELESTILKLLVDCGGSPVEDENLVKTLKTSKQTAEEVKLKMESIKKIDKELQSTREIYRAIATRGSILFFVVSDLASIDSMYQYSLQYIIKLFKNTIKATTDQGINRKKILIDNISKNIYKNVSRGVFEAHKSILSFLIAINIELRVDILPTRKWELLLKGSGVIDRTGQLNNPIPNVISEFGWDILTVLEKTFEEFNGFQKTIKEKTEFWEKFVQEENSYTSDFYDEYNEKFNKFDRLLLLKIFRPSYLLEGINQYIKDKLGDYYINAIESKIENIYEDSDNQTPMIFILSKGADPSNLIKSFGESKGFIMYDKLHPISLGQGQGVRAAKLIEQGMEEGSWVLLENCHLAKTWMPGLEKIIERLQESESHEIHEDFRLFLTSMPAVYFPISILQNSIKITTEPPRGLKANILRSINRVDQEFLEKANMKENFGKLMMSLCIFHAILQERRKFGPLGWNILYEFNDSDFDAAKDTLGMFLFEVEKRGEIPWDSVVFLAGIITYGGRVTDDQDRRLLFTTINKFFSDNVLDDKYRFSTDDTYKMPKSDQKSVYLDYIANFHNNDSPELFGLHSNADISYQQQEAHKIVQTILMVMPKADTTGSNSSSGSKIEEMISQFLHPDTGLPNELKADKGHKDLFVIQENGLIPPLSTVLFQEIDRFNRLIIRIRESLLQLQSAIEGTTTMSANLDQMFNSLLNNQIPDHWNEISYPSLKPLSSWFINFIKRVAFLRNWLEKGSISHYWLPGFFFPQGFLTGVLQTHARKLNEPIDKFQFTFKATDFFDDGEGEELVAPEDGVYVSGLFLEGAWWDRKRKAIVDQPEGEMYFKMPFIHFIPKEQNDFRGNMYSCPLYKTLTRAGTLSTTGQSTNFITEVQLPCDKIPTMWTMRGVALFCELRD